MKIRKILYALPLIALIILTGLAAAYGPEEIVDPEYTGPRVYRGYIINHSHERYLVVKITDSEELVRFHKQLGPERPVPMPYKKFGNGYLPDLHAYEKLLEKYYEEHRTALWMANILLPVGTFRVEYRWSELPESETKTTFFTLTQKELDEAEGPYMIEFYEEGDSDEFVGN